MIRAFSLERVNRAPASFDPQKLAAFQDRYMRLVPVEEKVASTLPYLQQAALVPDPLPDGVRAQLAAIIEAAGDRIKVAGDILEFADFFTPDDGLTYDEAAWQKRVVKPAEAGGLLSRFQVRLAQAEDFTAAAIEQLMQQFVQDESIGIGQIIHALRVAVTGKSVGFGMFETLAILGRERCLNRIAIALQRLSSST
jgi:glutamyl-tRNA synthetase